MKNYLEMWAMSHELNICTDLGLKININLFAV